MCDFYDRTIFQQAHKTNNTVHFAHIQFSNGNLHFTIFIAQKGKLLCLFIISMYLHLCRGVYTFLKWGRNQLKKYVRLCIRCEPAREAMLNKRTKKKFQCFLPLRRAQCEVLCASTKYKAFFVFFLLLLNYARVEGGMRAIYIGSTRWSQTHASLCCCIHNSRVRIQTNILANILEKVSLGK